MDISHLYNYSIILESTCCSLNTIITEQPACSCCTSARNCWSSARICLLFRLSCTITSRICNRTSHKSKLLVDCSPPLKPTVVYRISSCLWWVGSRCISEPQIAFIFPTNSSESHSACLGILFLYLSIMKLALQSKCYCSRSSRIVVRASSAF